MSDIRNSAENVICDAVREDHDPLGLGERVIAALSAEGYVVVDAETHDRWQAELSASLERQKAVALAAVRANGARCLLVELARVSGKLSVIVCDPDGDEAQTVRRVAKALKFEIEEAFARQTPGEPPGPVGGAP